MKLIQSANKPTSEDSYDVFAKSMAAKLRLISETDKKAAAVCEMEIHKIIHEKELSLL